MTLREHLQRLADARHGYLIQSNRNRPGTIHNWTVDALSRRGWVRLTLAGSTHFASWHVHLTDEGRKALDAMKAWRSK